MKIGVVAGNFDIIHPGYIHMFNEIERHCDRIFILLHDDPTIERPEKCKPILSISDRKEMLSKLITDCIILTYNTEAELYFLLTSIDPDIRFLGEDYIEKEFTGEDLYIPIHYITRHHGWSTTKFKKAIADEIQRSSNI